MRYMSDYILTSNGELYHHGVKGMKWGVRKSDYGSMSRSAKRQTRRTYKQDKLDRKAEKRVEKHGLTMANTISIGKGAVSTALKGSLGLTGIAAAGKLYTTTNALGLMAGVTSGSTAASLATAATLTGIGTIPVAALGAYGLYSAGKRIYKTARERDANYRAQAKRS